MAPSPRCELHLLHSNDGLAISLRNCSAILYANTIFQLKLWRESQIACKWIPATASNRYSRISVAHSSDTIIHNELYSGRNRFSVIPMHTDWSISSFLACKLVAFFVVIVVQMAHAIAISSGWQLTEGISSLKCNTRKYTIYERQPESVSTVEIIDLLYYAVVRTAFHGLRHWARAR